MSLGFLGLSFSSPWVLALLPAGVLPFFLKPLEARASPSLDALPGDPLSSAIDWGLRIAGALAFTALLFALAGARLPERKVEHVGEGGHIVLLIDRSSSMDETFAGHTPTGGEESKSQAAKRLLQEFVSSRDHDDFGVGLFSTAPISVLPVTSHYEAVKAAIAAIDRPALAFTDMGRGIAMALDTAEEDKSPAQKAIMIVSDGAAVLDRKLQESLRAEFLRQPVNLYWLYLRTAGSRSINDVPALGTEDSPQVLPERHLNKFFQSLKVPYQAYEAESPEAVQSAITEIGKLEKRPIIYAERIPLYDLSWLFYSLGALSLLVLCAAALAVL